MNTDKIMRALKTVRVRTIIMFDVEEGMRVMKGYITQDITHDGRFSLMYRSPDNKISSHDGIEAHTLVQVIEAFADVAGYTFEIEPNEEEVVPILKAFFADTDKEIK